MITLDGISMTVIAVIRLGVVFRFVYCMVALQDVEKEQAQLKKRARNTVIFYVIAKSIWQIKELIFFHLSPSDEINKLYLEFRMDMLYN